MSSLLLTFLSHGGGKLFIIGFYFVARILKANAQKAKQRDAKLRGNTGIVDFSAPTAPSTGAAEMTAPDSPFASAPSAPQGAAKLDKPLTLKTSLSPSGEIAVFKPKPVAKSANPAAKSPKSAPDSPWSSNQNPFN